ncbi:MAG TPA: glycosyltransferase, partial [Mycobacterium sp.]|nr:glycosyltransferase [Mycobacterium sp.]
VERFRSCFAQLDYVVEPTPGLSHARNRAVDTISTEVVAWIDDDETADENWLAEIVETFRLHPDAAAVSGSIVPAELEAWPQWWFEKYGGHRKGRGFAKVVFPHGDTGSQSPLYPLPAYGAGANMALRSDVLAELGGFDYGLGAGTATFGGEDTLVFTQLLLSGHTVVYQPAAMTRHFHRRGLGELQRQMFGYGVGLTAYYAALLRWNWRLLLPLLRLLPRAVADVVGGTTSAVTADLPDDFPTGLRRLKLRGMLLGPVAYVRARRAASSS